MEPSRSAWILALVTCSAACSEEDTGPPELALERLSVPDFGSWEANRPIEFHFNQRIDFASVSGDSIRIRTSAGVPAAGTFAAKSIDRNGDGAPDGVDERVVVFFPSCPLAVDLSDAGFTPGARYLVRLDGADSGKDPESLLRSRSGKALASTVVQAFETIADLVSALHDEKPGAAPLPVVRARGASSGTACHLELGDDPSNQVYFEAGQDLGRTPVGFHAPLNLFGDRSTRVAFVVVFDQLIRETPENLARLHLEYNEVLESTAWRVLETRTELLSNCGSEGASARLVALGIFPPGGFVRVAIEAGFEDRLGEATSARLDEFAITEVEVPSFRSLAPAGAIADEIREEFDFGPGSLLSLADPRAPVGTTEARWGDGELRPGFGVPALPPELSDFDWVVLPGTPLFDTRSQTIFGGPDGSRDQAQHSIGGFVAVRNFVVQEGATLRARGPNPLVIHATGSVTIRGRIDINGSDAHRVSAGGGGGGGPGGGAGGSASDSADARGNPGLGPPGTVEQGGGGGESGFSAIIAPGASGGGGRFARDQGSLVAASGSDGGSGVTGAESGLSPPRGGVAGIGPFVDGDPENDFFGTAPIVADGKLVGLRPGELTGVHGGDGGGNGGDAIVSTIFPPSPSANVRQGGGGGGGGGVVVIRASGPIRFGDEGQIVANGGSGAAVGNGANSAGGSGSGGHVILESAEAIDFTDGNPAVAPRAWIRALGGASFRVGRNVGGAGGPGVVQLHVARPELAPRPDSGVVLPQAALGSADPLARVCQPRPVVLFPTLVTNSAARSLWIPLAGAGEEHGVALGFDGIQTEPGPDEGKVETVGGRVPELPPLLGPARLAQPGVALRPNGFTLALQESVLAPLRERGGAEAIGPDVYLRGPALLAGMTLRLANAGEPARRRDLTIAAARYDDRSVVLELDLGDLAGPLRSAVDELGGLEEVELVLVPRFFRLRQGSDVDVLADSRSVRILFQGAAEDGTGHPDETSPLVDWTADVTKFGAFPPGTLAFVRFQVEFDLDVNDVGFDPLAESLSLEFLRLPFRF